MKHLGRHLRGNLVAYLALFVSLSGVAYARVNLPSKSVHTRQIANGAVTRTKIAKGAIDSTKLSPGAVDSSKIADGSVEQSDLAPPPANELEALRNSPAVEVQRNKSQSISNKIWTSLAYEGERFDTGGAWSGEQSTRLTAPFPGVYLAAGTFDFESNANGERIARIVKGQVGKSTPSEALAENLVPGQVKVEESAAGNAMNVATRPFTLEAGDWITMDVYQSSGSALSVLGDSVHKVEFGMVWIRPLP